MWFILLGCQREIARHFPRGENKEEVANEEVSSEEIEGVEESDLGILDEIDLAIMSELGRKSIENSIKNEKVFSLPGRSNSSVGLYTIPEDPEDRLWKPRSRSFSSGETDRERFIQIREAAKAIKANTIRLSKDARKLLADIDHDLEQTELVGEMEHNDSSTKVPLSTTPPRTRFELTEEECNDLIKKLPNLGEFLKLLRELLRDKDMLPEQKARIIEAIESHPDMEYLDKVKAKKYLTWDFKPTIKR